MIPCTPKVSIYIENTIITGYHGTYLGPNIHITCFETQRSPIDAGNNNRKYIFITLFNNEKYVSSLSFPRLLASLGLLLEL